ncbi:MAG: ribosomal-processing cysteine protease Prp [Oscillospiraceae bacterium]|nr:ribosomal-processing cysteine protease Prp [Oscillospiraceae bacterium]
MTSIEFFSPDDRIDGFCSSGHSGYGEAGTDIVCAAVSAAVHLTITTIVDVLGVNAKVRVQEDEARITVKLPSSCEDSEDAVQAILAGLMLTLCSLRDDYPDYIEVMEV